MKPQRLPRAVHGVPAFLAGLVAGLLTGMAVKGSYALFTGEPFLPTLAVTVGGALLAALPFGPLAAIAFVPVFLGLRALRAFRPVPAATAFGVLAITLAWYISSSPIGAAALGTAGIVFGWVSAVTFASAAARDAS